MEEFAKAVNRKRIKVGATHTLNVTPSVYQQVEKEILREIMWPEGLRKFVKGDRVIIQRQNKFHRSNQGQIIGQVKNYVDGVLIFSVLSISELL